MRGLSLVAASGGHSSSRCAGLSLSQPLVAEHRLQTCRLSSLWLTGPVAPWHVGSSQTRARTRVPCIRRQTLNHCATREAPQSVFYLQVFFFKMKIFFTQIPYACCTKSNRSKVSLLSHSPVFPRPPKKTSTKFPSSLVMAMAQNLAKVNSKVKQKMFI